jgi:phosphoglycolate phosphatase
MATIVIWDWNGTLLNDVAQNHRILNSMLEKRGLRRIGIDEYRKLFRMPIIELYRDLGFTFKDETFEEAAREYFKSYTQEFTEMPLTDGALEALTAIRGKKAGQYIVSAMNEPDLREQVKARGIFGFFEAIFGLDNVHARSKKQRAFDLVDSLPSKADILFIGDMDHDYEVARAIGARCLLYDKGHQRIPEEGDFTVIGDLREASLYL